MPPPRRPASPRGRARWCRRRGSGTGRRCRQSPTDWSALPARSAARPASRQRRDQRHRVIGQRRGAHRLRRRIWRGSGRRKCGSRPDPARHRAALQGRAREDARIVPQAGAEQLDVAQIRARRGQRIAPIATTESPSSAMNSASAVPSACATVARRASARSAPYFSNATMRPPLRPTACLNAASTTLP